MGKTIKSRIILMVAGVMAIVFMILLAGNYFLAEHFYVGQRSRMMKSAYRSVTELVQASDMDGLTKMMREYEEKGGFQFILADESYQIFYNSRQETVKGSGADQSYAFNFKKKADQFREDPEPVRRDTEDDKIRLGLYGIVHGTDGITYVVIRTTYQTIEADVQGTGQFLLVCSIPALLLGGVAAYLSSLKLSRPLEEIEQVAVSVSRLDFTKRAGRYESIEELDRLAVSIDQMSENLEKAIRRLKRENEIREEFTANVSHELKTPLAILRGYAEVLQKNGDGIDRTYYCDVILEETDYMTQMVSRLLEVASLEHDGWNMEFEPLDLIPFLEEFMAKNQVLLDQKSLTCRCPRGGSFRVKANRFYLEQALTNYLTNAIAHTAEGEQIELSVREDREQIRISLFNPGEPVREQDREKIFDSFYQADRSRTRTEERNLGLGLYLVRIIMECHGGTCGAENRENGVCFYLTLEPWK